MAATNLLLRVNTNLLKVSGVWDGFIKHVLKLMTKNESEIVELCVSDEYGGFARDTWCRLARTPWAHCCFVTEKVIFHFYQIGVISQTE